jgi:hypothetical protein
VAKRAGITTPLKDIPVLLTDLIVDSIAKALQTQAMAKAMAREMTESRTMTMVMAMEMAETMAEAQLAQYTKPLRMFAGRIQPIACSNLQCKCWRVTTVT